MLDTVALNYEMPLVWMPFVMPQERKTSSVEMIENGFGEDTVVFRVGQKMMYVTMGEDFARDDIFITTVSNAYVTDLKKRRGYQYPASFEMKAGGGYAEVSPEDEKALVEFLAKQDAASIESSKQRGEKAITHRVVGAYFSAENGIVFKNPAHPVKPPEQRKDKRLDH